MEADLTLHLLTGPTAVGKTELALRWAEAFQAEIISADSLLFYQGMDIGTAKPNAADRARVPHHLINIAPVSEPLNVSRYVELALHAVRDVQRRGKRVLVTGGSGFYLKAFYAPVADDTLPMPAARAEVEQIEQTLGLAGLLTRLRELNPNGLGSLDICNPRRVARALERCLASGKTLSELEQAFAKAESPFARWPKKTVLLTREKESLAARIAQRTTAMLEAGLVDEVKNLISAGIRQNSSATRAIGYRETLDWLEKGETDLAGLEAAISLSTRQLAARQRKWFRNQLEPDKTQEMGPGDPDVESLFD